MHEQIGSYIQVQRKLRGLTQAQLAEAIGVLQGTLASWESGRIHIAQRHLPKLAVAMGLPLEHLCAQWLPPQRGRRAAKAPRTPRAYLPASGSVKGTVKDMLELGVVISDAYQQAWKLLPQQNVHHEMALHYPRDSVLELAAAYQALAWGALLKWLAPRQVGCDLPVVIAGTQRYAGDLKRHTLVLLDGQATIIMFPQVSLMVVSQSRERRLDMLVKYTRDGVSCWGDIEFDGFSTHQNPAEDARRMWGMGLRRLSYNTAAVCSNTFMERLLSDLYALWCQVRTTKRTS
jgi:transcriptional regulator with XRE-family HTH domain